MFDAIKLGCGFQLGRALYGLGFVALIAAAVLLFAGLVALNDWRDRRKRAKK